MFGRFLGPHPLTGTTVLRKPVGEERAYALVLMQAGGWSRRQNESNVFAAARGERRGKEAATREFCCSFGHATRRRLVKAEPPTYLMAAIAGASLALPAPSRLAAPALTERRRPRRPLCGIRRPCSAYRPIQSGYRL
jgi:hypothetical protein